MHEVLQEGGVLVSVWVHLLDFEATDHAEEKACCYQGDQSNCYHWIARKEEEI